MALTDFNTHRADTARMQDAPRFSFLAMLNVWRTRRALARLDSSALEDIGVSSDRAAAEAAKPIWDVPATWRL